MRRPPSRVCLLATIFVAGAACDRAVTPHVAAAGTAQPQGDTLLPPPRLIERFQAALPRRATALTGGADTRDALVARFVAAVEAGDATALRALTLDVVEFGWLYFPDSRYTTAPYELPPETLWLLIEQNGLKGETRLLRHYGGRPLRTAGYTCEPRPRMEGMNRLWEECTVQRRDDHGRLVNERLFGSILERDGRWKFVSFANRL